jgi:energy-coupling factor transport system ATP-binding protein
MRGDRALDGGLKGKTILMEDNIRAERLSFSYPEEEGRKNAKVLDGVDITIDKGSFVAILGHNGSGKSTLAKHMNAILLPSGGAMSVFGLDTKDESALLEIRRRVGMVFQNPDNQMVANVVEEDVAFAPENLGVPTEEIRRRVDDALAAVGMSEFARQAPHLLSGGQKQRVAIAGVLAMEPECIVLDEATAMLDPMGRRDVLETVHRLNREKGMTVVLITHHMSEAEDADRVIVMNRGKIYLDGAPREIFQKVEEMDSIGLTVPDTVKILWRLRRSGADVPLTAITPEECADAIMNYIG